LKLKIADFKSKIEQTLLFNNQFAISIVLRSVARYSLTHSVRGVTVSGRRSFVRTLVCSARTASSSHSNRVQPEQRPSPEGVTCSLQTKQNGRLSCTVHPPEELAKVVG